MQKRWIRKNLKNKLRIGHTVVEWGIQASELWESCLSGSLVPRQDGFVPLKFNSQSNKSKTLLANTCERVERGNYFTCQISVIFLINDKGKKLMEKRTQLEIMKNRIRSSHCSRIDRYSIFIAQEFFHFSSFSTL